MSYEVRNNEQESRFETTVDGHVAFSSYRLEPGRIVFTHTEVPKELGGRGIANEIVSNALDYAREKGLKVVPNCRFVASYIGKNPQYQDLVA